MPCHPKRRWHDLHEKQVSKKPLPCLRSGARHRSDFGIRNDQRKSQCFANCAKRDTSRAPRFDIGSGEIPIFLKDSRTNITGAILDIRRRRSEQANFLESKRGQCATQGSRRKKGKVPWQFQAVPVCSEHPGFPGIDIWKPEVGDPAGFQPFQNLCQKLAWVIDVLEKIETRNDVEAFRKEGGIESFSYKNLRPRGSFRFLRRRGFPFDSVQLPGFAPHRSQERAQPHPMSRMAPPFFYGGRDHVALSLPTARR